MAKGRISTVSKNYAKALIQVAKESGSFDYYKSQLQEVREVLESSEDLRIVMDNSSISVVKKNEILDSLFANKIDIKILNFLKLLVSKNRFGELYSIINSYNEIIDTLSNKKNVEIVSSIELNFETKSNILFKLEHKLQCEVIPHWSVDESIIAGLQFKFDDYVIDSSVRSKIENLGKNISR